MRIIDHAANHVLASLPADDFANLEKHLTSVELPARMMLQRAGQTVENVYFPVGGLVSVVVAAGPSRESEVGMIGFDGFSGHTAVLADGRAPVAMHMLIAGKGLRISAESLRFEMRKSEALRESLCCFLTAFWLQTAFTALANSDGNVAERLARWILMAHDRSDGDDITITHEAISRAIGVRRPGVTTALRNFVASGFISTSRAVLQVRDRIALEASAGGLYGPSERELARLTGRHADAPPRATAFSAQLQA